MLVLAGLYATLFAQVSLLVSSMNEEDNRFQEKLDNADEQMRNMGLPTELKNRVKTYYQYVWKRSKFLDRDAFFQDLSSSLEHELRLYVFEEMMVSSFFVGVQPFFLIMVAQTMQTICCLQGDFIVRHGQKGQCMYFVTYGTCHREFREEEEIARSKKGMRTILKKCDYFGEMAVLTQLSYTDTVQAYENCDLAVLQYEDLSKAMFKYPDSAMKVCCWDAEIVYSSFVACASQRMSSLTNVCAFLSHFSECRY
jgi:CRP-like cAMP-binding protein